jgi:four helix bundle protein
VKSDLPHRTKQFALEIVRLYSSLPRGIVPQVLGKQFLRSGTSVGANYREASRARSDAEFSAKIGDCLKELEETIYWLELLIESNTSPISKTQPSINEAAELIAILTTIDKKVKQRTV